MHTDRMLLDTMNSRTEQKPFRKMGSLGADTLLVSDDESNGDTSQPMYSSVAV